MAERGKTYYCRVCGQEIMATKAGPGTLVCCDEEMVLVIPEEEK